MGDEWVNVQVYSAVDAGELLAIMGDPSVQGAWQDGQSIHLYWPADCWSPDRYRTLQQTLHHLEATGASDTRILIQTIPHEDWNRTWAQSVKPLRLGKRIVIRPSWETVELHQDQIDIILDPKQAFGTGHHATTRLLLEWLEESVHGDESVLDVGTGSGLLAMVALRLGARYARGIDHDPVAIECAAEYARVNGFSDELVLECGTLETMDRFDLVLANLDRGTLLSLAGDLAAATRYRLLVSGILIDQRPEIVSAFAEQGLYSVAEREAEGWLAIEFGAAQSCEGA
ncbi:MAG TPA: 50S ribosomal protein L11 methyltransferase [Nitrospira sp.]|nr:50S ribosomal protein L11 methyltransferase [Nitrospira sp.]